MAYLPHVRLRPESPANLAVFRIAVCAILLVSPEWRQGPSWATVPEALRFPPEGLAWAIHRIPVMPAVARVAQVAFAVATPLALAGLYTRCALIVTTLSALYLFGLRQLTGSVLHDMHLLWFATLLAASPSGDAISLDSVRARRRGTPLPTDPSLAYAWPLATARVLLGLVYFFPGAWKLASSGWAWALSDNLRNQMYWKWYELGWVPSLRIDHYPIVCRACAVSVILFELSFLPLALVRRTQPFIAAAGITFHIATQRLMGIPFFGLWGCYVVLFHWAWLLEPRRRDPEPLPRPLGRAWTMGVVIVAIVAIQGARGAVQAWPFACYPTFQWRVGTEIPDVVMTAVFDDGHEVRLLPGAKSQAAWATAWSVAGSMRGAPSARSLRAYWNQAMRDPAVHAAVASAREVRFARGWFSVVPEDKGKPPRREDPLGAISLRP